MEKMLLIEWVDSIITPGWEFKDKVVHLVPKICYSVGFLIDDAVDYKTLCLGTSPDQVIARMSIPVGCIKKITELMEIG